MSREMRAKRGEARSPARGARAGRADWMRVCRRLPGVTEDVKWGQDLVFSVGGKMFAVFDLEDSSGVSFRTTPALFDALTAKEGVEPAPYLARHHWLLVTTSKALAPGTMRDLLAESHRLVASGLPARVRKSLGLREE